MDKKQLKTLTNFAKEKEEIASKEFSEANNNIRVKLDEIQEVKNKIQKLREKIDKKFSSNNVVVSSLQLVEKALLAFEDKSVALDKELVKLNSIANEKRDLWLEKHKNIEVLKSLKKKMDEEESKKEAMLEQLSLDEINNM